MQDRDLVYSCTIYEIARSGYAVSQCHLMSVLWVGWGGGGSCRFPLESLEMLESLRLLKSRLSNDN